MQAGRHFFKRWQCKNLCFNIFCHSANQTMKTWVTQQTHLSLKWSRPLPKWKQEKDLRLFLWFYCHLKHFQVFHLDWRKIIYCMALAALFLSLMQPSSILLCCNMYKKRLLCDSLTVCVSSWTFHLNFNLMQLNCPSFAHFCIIHEV